MGLHSWANSRDAIEPEVCAALRALNIPYAKMSHAGVPDLIIGWRAVNYLIELKSQQGRLTPAQKRFHARWRGPIHICTSIDEVLEVINPSAIFSRGCR